MVVCIFIISLLWSGVLKSSLKIICLCANFEINLINIHLGGICTKGSEESEKVLKLCKEEEKTINLNRCIKKIKDKVF